MCLLMVDASSAQEPGGLPEDSGKVVFEKQRVQKLYLKLLKHGSNRYVTREIRGVFVGHRCSEIAGGPLLHHKVEKMCMQHSKGKETARNSRP